METVAVYCENKIRTYGFQVEQGLILIRIALGHHELGRLGSVFYHQESDIRFTWVLIQKHSAKRVDMYLLVHPDWLPSVSALLDSNRTGSPTHRPRATSGLSLICFHGPHFGDRYGIANTALDTLDCRNVPVLLSGCSGASVYIVVPDRHATETTDILSEVFEKP